jgi:hypothetical protein
MDDFTIILPELTDITSCDLKVYDGLERLWRMVERYKMTAPITITVVDKTERPLRAIRGHRIQAGAWQLEDTLTAATPPMQDEFEFPLTINVKDAKGNILKMRLQLEVAKPEFGQKKVDPPSPGSSCPSFRNEKSPEGLAEVPPRKK